MLSPTRAKRLSFQHIHHPAGKQVRLQAFEERCALVGDGGLHAIAQPVCPPQEINVSPEAKVLAGVNEPRDRKAAQKQTQAMPDLVHVEHQA